MTLCIIGGSGFLSGTLAREALAAGHAVWAVSRGRRPALPGVQSVVVDRKDHAAFAHAIRAAGVTWDLAVDSIGLEPADAEQDAATLRDCGRHLAHLALSCAGRGAKHGRWLLAHRCKDGLPQH